MPFFGIVIIIVLELRLSSSMSSRDSLGPSLFSAAIAAALVAIPPSSSDNGVKLCLKPLESRFYSGRWETATT